MLHSIGCLIEQEEEEEEEEEVGEVVVVRVVIGEMVGQWRSWWY